LRVAIRWVLHYASNLEVTAATVKPPPARVVVRQTGRPPQHAQQSGCPVPRCPVSLPGVVAQNRIWWCVGTPPLVCLHRDEQIKGCPRALAPGSRSPCDAVVGPARGTAVATLIADPSALPGHRRVAHTPTWHCRDPPRCHRRPLPFGHRHRRLWIIQISLGIRTIEEA